MATLETNKENTVNFRMIVRTAALAASCLLGTAAAWAQGAPASSKLGVINIQQAIATTAEGKQASADLQAQFAPRQSELEGISKQINDIRQRLSAGASTLSEEEKARLAAEGQKLTTRYERRSNELNEDVQSAQSEIIDRIGRKLVDILDRYARENNFTAILNSAGQNSPVLYFSPNSDVTAEIIKLYDQAYPAKAGAAPAKPAAAPAKPAPKP